MMMRERDHIMLSTPPFFSSSVRRVPAFWAISGVMPTRCIWASSAGILSQGGFGELGGHGGLVPVVEDVQHVVQALALKQGEGGCRGDPGDHAGDGGKAQDRQHQDHQGGEGGVEGVDVEFLGHEGLDRLDAGDVEVGGPPRRTGTPGRG